jgi:UDP-glucuronate 4-epimerase
VKKFAIPNSQFFIIMKRILVTGGAGFIGSHLVDHILASVGAHVTVVDNFHNFYDPATKRANVASHLGRGDFELVEADICDSQAMDDLFARSRFDCVVHLAALAGVRPSLKNPLEYERTNVRGTFTLLEAARLTKVSQFVFASSSSVYGLNSKIPFSEEDRISNPISPYAATKVAGEAACSAYSHLYDLRVVCLRLFTVYGPRQRPDLAIHKFARLMSKGQPVPIFGDASTRRDYTFVDDIVSGLMAAMNYDKTKFEIINLGESEPIELRRLVELLERALGKRANVEQQPGQPGDVPVTYADIDKARRLLGYNPKTNIETGVQRFAEWFRKTDASMNESHEDRDSRSG